MKQRVLLTPLQSCVDTHLLISITIVVVQSKVNIYAVEACVRIKLLQFMHNSYTLRIMRLKKLSEVADIKSGYSFRGAVRDEGVGVRVIQAKDVSNGYVSGVDLPRVSDHIPNDKYLAPGDIVLTSRGSFRAGVFMSDEPSVASSSVFVLRVTNQSYLPEYLAIYLNSPQAQSYISQVSRGATIHSLRISDLHSLEVPQLPIEDQQNMVDLHTNVRSLLSALNRKSEIINDIFTGAVSRTLEGVK